MTKQEILEYFKDINHAYNESTRLDDLSHMLDELMQSNSGLKYYPPCEDCHSKMDEIRRAYDRMQSNSDEDCISRQAVLNLMRGLTRWCIRSEDGKFNNVGLLYDDVMFGIDRLSSVTPKPKTDVLDKIKAEIKEESKFCPLTEGLERALEIIDKYKVESEE